VRSAILFEELLPAKTSQPDQATAKQQHGGWLWDDVPLFSRPGPQKPPKIGGSRVRVVS